MTTHFASLTARAASHGRASLVVVGGSLGGHQALGDVLEQLPLEFPAPVLVVQHVALSSKLPEILAERTVLRVKWADRIETVQPGHIYFAPPGHHLRISRYGHATARRGDKVNYACPAVDPLFYSAARYYGRQVIAVVLSGRLYDGAAGAREIRRAGGIVIVQELGTCAESNMPRAALASTPTAIMLPPRSIGHALVSLTMARGTDALLAADHAKSA